MISLNTTPVSLRTSGRTLIRTILVALDEEEQEDEELLAMREDDDDEEACTTVSSSGRTETKSVLTEIPPQKSRTVSRTT